MNSVLARPWFAFFLGFVFPYLLTKIDFVSTVGGMSEQTEALIHLSIFAYSLGLLFCLGLRSCLAGFVLRKPLVVNVYIRQLTLLYVFLFAWFALGVLCLFYEFYSMGAIPLFSGDVEELRFKLQVSGAVHLIAISLGIVSTLFLVSASFLVGWRKLVFIFFGLMGFGFLALTGNRSDSMLCMVVTFLYFLFSRKSVFGIKFFVIAFLMLSGFVLVKFYREVSYGVDYLEMIEEQLTGESSFLKFLLYPLYMTLTYGYMILDRLVNAGVEAVEGGRYTFYAFYSLLPGAQVDFGTFKNEVLGIDFYAELTSTVVSNFYVDFGSAGVFVGVFLLAVLLGWAYGKAKQDRRFILLYALLYFHTLIYFYMYIYVLFIAFIHVLVYLFYCKFFLGVEVLGERSSSDVCCSAGLVQGG